jgi:hypothetical protein
MSIMEAPPNAEAEHQAWERDYERQARAAGRKFAKACAGGNFGDFCKAVDRISNKGSDCGWEYAFEAL